MLACNKFELQETGVSLQAAESIVLRIPLGKPSWWLALPPRARDKIADQTALATLAKTHEMDVLHMADSEELNNRLLLLEDSVYLAEFISLHLSAVGWDVVTCADAAQALLQVQQQPFAAIIADLCLPDGNLAGADFLAQLRQDGGESLPTIAISANWGWHSRLSVVRSGANAFLPKPVDINLLIDTLETLTGRKNPAPYRILIVDDSVAIARLHAQILRSAGMTVEVLTDPTLLLDALSNFMPDLILMDIYMPECNGLEAARIIRQDATYIGIPIVFLSSESERQNQMVTMSHGGDDFLGKPVNPDHLIKSVSARAERFRALAALMRQDSLTQLLNHAAFNEQLQIELLRLERDPRPLVLAMLDIDHFKEVNDLYGHPAGDMVLKSLAQLLRRRLRQTDCIGRYGGEEFIIALPGTSLEVAQNILEQLRESFSNLRFVGPGKEFRCTFSTGIAVAPARTELTQLVETADSALYRAKRNGRNRIELAATPESPTP